MQTVEWNLAFINIFVTHQTLAKKNPVTLLNLTFFF